MHFSGHGGTGELSLGPAARRDVAGEDAVAKEVDDEARPHGLFFQGPDGDAQLVSTAAIQQTFGAAGASVRLVVLSACYSDPQAEALLAHVGCVVGMRGSIRDDAARNFAIGFYGGLGERESVAAAYRQGCAAIGLEGLADGNKPRLSVRDGVDAEILVLADLADGGRAARPLATPTPAYLNAEIQALSEQLERARERKRNLRDLGLATDEVDREILESRRKLRDGGQLRAGDTLGDGRYLLVKPLGRGGFAVVWEGYDRNEQQCVAIKVLHQHLASDPQRKERFFRGARVMMDLQHSAVVRVYDPRGQDEAFSYFVMELVSGGNLRDAVLNRRVKPECLLPLILQVGEALAEAHERRLVHRDVKPANILLDEHGNAKLTDFDLVGAHDTTGGTRTGVLGTVLYAAPECLDKPQEATARADVFGLGMTAIFCILGHDLSSAVFRNPSATLARLPCSPLVRQVFECAVAWEPEERFANARIMATALREALDTSETMPPPLVIWEPGDMLMWSPERPRAERGQSIGTPSADHSERLGDRDDPDQSPPRDGEPVEQRMRAAIRAVPFEPIGDPSDAGEFSVTSPLRVLFRLATARATGLLLVAVGGMKKEIYVRDGQPEYVSSNVVSELFGNYLLKKNVLSDGELAMALAMMPHYGGKFGDTLVGLGLLKPLEVFRYLTRQCRAKIIDVCTWNNGSFGWYAGRQNPGEAFPLDFNAFELLGAGAMAVSNEFIEAWIARNAQLRLRAARTRRVGPEHFEVKGLVELCELLDGQRRVLELVESSVERGDQLRSGRMLNLLESCDLARPA